MDATRRTLGLSWGTVSYLDWNPLRAIDQDKPAVLLLHGGGVDNASLSWGELGPVLADAGYRVLAPDHPGYGQSPAAPWPHSQQRLVEREPRPGRSPRSNSSRFRTRVIGFSAIGLRSSFPPFSSSLPA